VIEWICKDYGDDMDALTLRQLAESEADRLNIQETDTCYMGNSNYDALGTAVRTDFVGRVLDISRGINAEIEQIRSNRNDRSK